jgi:hypothetical protein
MLCCSKTCLQSLYNLVEEEEKKTSLSKGLHRAKGLGYAQFIDLLDHVAQNCAFGNKNLNTPESKVRSMFHYMNASRGRSKLTKDSNSLIITPLTGLESTDLKFQSNSSHRKHVASKVTAMIASKSTTSVLDKDANELSPTRRRLPMAHYQHLRTIKTPPRPKVPETNGNSDDRPDWNFR